MTFIARCGLLMLLTVATSSFAADGLLVDEAAIPAMLDEAGGYVLLDARNAKAQRNAPIANAIRYGAATPAEEKLVLVIADDDASAARIVKSMPPAPGMSVLGVKGGARTWKRVALKLAASAPASTSFVIPMNTCEQGKPLQELKRNKPLQQSKKP